MAIKRFFKLDAVIPCHYGSFPIIDATAEKFIAAMQGQATKVIVPKKAKPFRCERSKKRSARTVPGAANNNNRTSQRASLLRLFPSNTGNVAAGNSNVGQFTVAQLRKFLHG